MSCAIIIARGWRLSHVAVAPFQVAAQNYVSHSCRCLYECRNLLTHCCLATQKLSLKFPSIPRQGPARTTLCKIGLFCIVLALDQR